MTSRNIVSEVRKRAFPLYGVMTVRDYISVRRAKPKTHGMTRVAGENIAYSDKSGIMHSAKEIFQDTVYRFDAKTDAPHIIDAGANIGLSVLFFKKMYPNSTIVAYEPDAAIFKLLQKNTAHMAGIELHQAAAWVDNTELTFFTNGSLAGSTELDYDGADRRTIIKAERLRDQIIKRPVDFLKIDIEGAENKVLFDIEDQLDNIDHLFFEYHSSPMKPQLLGDMLSLVTRHGFRYSINGTHGAKLPFIDKISQGFDLQLNVFCYRTK